MRFTCNLFKYKNKIFKFKFFLLATHFYSASYAPFFTDLLGAAAVSMLLDEEKPSSYVVDEIKSQVHVYENYLRDVSQNITDSSKVRNLTIRFINGLSSEKASKKMCAFYDLKQSSEDRLTIGQIMIYIFCCIKTPIGWDDEFKLRVLIPLGLNSSSIVKTELARTPNAFSLDTVNQIVSRMAAIPIQRTPDRPDSCRPGASPASSTPSGTPPASSSYLSSRPTRR